MEETKRNSIKLDIEAARSVENESVQPVESYKQITENDSNHKSSGELSFYFIFFFVQYLCGKMIRQN